MMNKIVRTMLDRMYEAIKAKVKDDIESWDCLIEFIAADNCPNFQPVNLDWLTSDFELLQALSSAYDPELLRSDFYDHLGDMYLERISPAEPQPDLKPVHVAGEECVQPERLGDNCTILDPVAGSGKRLMALHKAVPSATLFGVVRDLRLFRIAYINFRIHDVHGFLLHADSSIHNIDISIADGIFNWKYANNWNSNMDKLRVNETSGVHSKRPGGVV